MVLFAKRVSAPKWAPKRASTSETPSALAACWIESKYSWHWLCDSISTGICGSHLDVVEARGTGAVAGADHLLGLSLAAIWNAPQHPMIAIGDGGAGIPKLCGYAAVSGVLQHANAFAVFDLPADFATELEVVALVVDGPAAIGLHVNGVADAREDFVERLLARQQTDVGHADQREPRPTGGAHGPVGARGADGRGGLARGHIANELPVANDVVGLRGHAFVVVREGAHAGAVFDTRVADGVDQIGTIAQVIQFIEREKAHARVIGLRAQHAIELDGMADGFVNLEPDLAAVQDQIEAALGALIG